MMSFPVFTAQNEDPDPTAMLTLMRIPGVVPCPLITGTGKENVGGVAMWAVCHDSTIWIKIPAISPTGTAIRNASGNHLSGSNKNPSNALSAKARGKPIMVSTTIIASPHDLGARGPGEDATGLRCQRCFSQ